MIRNRRLYSRNADTFLELGGGGRGLRVEDLDLDEEEGAGEEEVFGRFLSFRRLLE